MAHDALDPGPLADYPYFPRVGGTPLWSDTAATDGIPISGVTPMPRGLRAQSGTTIDLTPRNPDGTPLTPPTPLPSHPSSRDPHVTLPPRGPAL